MIELCNYSGMFHSGRQIVTVTGICNQHGVLLTRCDVSVMRLTVLYSEQYPWPKIFICCLTLQLPALVCSVGIKIVNSLIQYQNRCLQRFLQLWVQHVFIECRAIHHFFYHIILFMLKFMWTCNVLEWWYWSCGCRCL